MRQSTGRLPRRYDRQTAHGQRVLNTQLVNALYWTDSEWLVFAQQSSLTLLRSPDVCRHGTFQSEIIAVVHDQGFLWDPRPNPPRKLRLAAVAAVVAEVNFVQRIPV